MRIVLVLIGDQLARQGQPSASYGEFAAEVVVVLSHQHLKAEARGLHIPFIKRSATAWRDGAFRAGSFTTPTPPAPYISDAAAPLAGPPPSIDRHV